MVFASNILEHFPPHETIGVLREWMRVVRLTGYLELVVPDSLGVLADHFAGVNSWAECEERLRGSRDYPGNEHFAAFTRTAFKPIVETAGYRLGLIESSNAGGGFRALLEHL